MANTTWNPSDKSANITLTGGDLTATQSAAGANGGVRTVHRQRTGKYYWECTQAVGTNIQTGAGITLSSTPLGNGISATSQGPNCGISRNGNIYLTGVLAVTGAGTLANGTVVGIALDCDNGLIWFRVAAAGIWNNSASANPATGAGGVAFGFGRGANAVYAWASGGAQNDQIVANFGNTAFAGAVPSSFTSGFPDTTPANIAAATQVALEHWVNANADARMTQVFLEHWGPAGTSQPRAVLTQAALEMWLTVAPPSRGGPMVTMIW